jgi:hypothetical protein
VRRVALTAAALALLAATGCAKGITNVPPTSISDHDAGLPGWVISDIGGEVEYWVEYGPTKAYGLESDHDTVTIGKHVQQLVVRVVDGLTPATVYHYRLCARDSQQQGGPGCSQDQRFKTQSFACGDTVTTDVKLTGDLECHSGGIKPGIRVGANGIEIDLNGYEMNGGYFASGGQPGIDNRDGFDDVTIRGGRVASFGNEIAISGASRNRILGVTTSGLGQDIQVTGGTGLEIRHSEAGGIRLESLSYAVVADNPTLYGGFDDALALRNVSNSRVVRNHVLFGTTTRPRYGISIHGNDNFVQDNAVNAWGGAGIGVLAGSGNRLISNELLNTTFPEEPQPGDGIFVGAFTAGTLVRDNFAHDSNDDGIEVAAPSARIGGNRADDNGDFGIDAVAGVTDLGGNTASGNGNPLQCRNVFCP